MMKQILNNLRALTVMIRLILLLTILFLVFGNFTVLCLNDLIVIFSLINIAFYSVLIGKKYLKLGDYFIFICSCSFIEIIYKLALINRCIVVLLIPLTFN